MAAGGVVFSCEHVLQRAPQAVVCTGVALFVTALACKVLNLRMQGFALGSLPTVLTSLASRVVQWLLPNAVYTRFFYAATGGVSVHYPCPHPALQELWKKDLGRCGNEQLWFRQQLSLPLGNDNIDMLKRGFRWFLEPGRLCMTAQWLGYLDKQYPDCVKWLRRDETDRALCEWETNRTPADLAVVQSAWCVVSALYVRLAVAELAGDCVEPTDSRLICDERDRMQQVQGRLVEIDRTSLPEHWSNFLEELQKLVESSSGKAEARVKYVCQIADLFYGVHANALWLSGKKKDTILLITQSHQQLREKNFSGLTQTLYDLHNSLMSQSVESGNQGRIYNSLWMDSLSKCVVEFFQES